MDYKEALQTMGEALQIANAECRILKEAKERLQASNEQLLNALTIANRTIRELSTSQPTNGKFQSGHYGHRQPTDSPCRIVSLKPAANGI